MKHVFITGGSRGIGEACVRAFAGRGDAVTFLYEKNHEAAKALAMEVGAVAVQGDVGDGDCMTRIFEKLGTVDLLINNAAISHMGLISDITSAQWDRMFDVNVKGIYHCVSGALPSMIHQHKGCIINIGSMWGQVGASCEVCYSATKGAVIALTQALAKELAPSGIRVNCVSPGVIETDMVRELGEETLTSLAEETPLGRIGTCMDVAQAVLYLAEAEFVTGQVLGVNGGFQI